VLLISAANSGVTLAKIESVVYRYSMYSHMRKPVEDRLAVEAVK
jgi:hypothetical protein